MAKKKKTGNSGHGLLWWLLIGWWWWLLFGWWIALLRRPQKDGVNVNPDYKPPVVPWSSWGEAVHETRAQADRMLRAQTQNIKVKRFNPDGISLVRGSTGTVYRTTYGGCTCEDFVKRGRPCKHMYALAIQKAGFDPAPYTWGIE